MVAVHTVHVLIINKAAQMVIMEDAEDDDLLQIYDWYNCFLVFLFLIATDNSCLFSLTLMSYMAERASATEEIVLNRDSDCFGNGINI